MDLEGFVWYSEKKSQGGVTGRDDGYYARFVDWDRKRSMSVSKRRKRLGLKEFYRF